MPPPPQDRIRPKETQRCQNTVGVERRREPGALYARIDVHLQMYKMSHKGARAFQDVLVQWRHLLAMSGN